MNRTTWNRGGAMRALVAVAALAWAVAPSLAADPVNKSRLGGIAIKGYDPVAYFTAGAPTKGDRRFEQEWSGAIWRFASAANRDRFAADPERYAPQYGGFCAYAVSEGGTAAIDPESWSIVDGKLYLNYSAKIQAQWEADVAGHIARADENWPKIVAEW